MIKAYTIENRKEYNADSDRALSTFIRFLGARSEKLDAFAAAAVLEDYKQSKGTLLSVLAAAAVRLEAAERRIAELEIQ